MNLTSERDLENLCINTIRILSADAVQNANAGHPGMPMGAAATISGLRSCPYAAQQSSARTQAFALRGMAVVNRTLSLVRRLPATSRLTTRLPWWLGNIIVTGPRR